MAQLGVIRQGPSFTMTVPRAKSSPPSGAAPASVEAQSPYTGPYAGVEPGAISAQPFLDYMEQVQTMALDPQAELRQREQQQLQEQTRAQLAARGLNLSGVGAGIEGDVMSDFALDWQDRALGRAGAGGQILGNLGSLGQDIARAGFVGAQELGASAFEYDPEIMDYGGGGAPSISYSPAPVTYGGVGGGRSFREPSVFQQRRAEQQAYADMLNAQAARDRQQPQPYRGGYHYGLGDEAYRPPTATELNAIAPGGGGIGARQGTVPYGPYLSDRPQSDVSRYFGAGPTLNYFTGGSPTAPAGLTARRDPLQVPMGGGMVRTYAQYVPGLTAAFGGTPQPIRERDYLGRKVYGPFRQNYDYLSS